MKKTIKLAALQEISPVLTAEDYKTVRGFSLEDTKNFKERNLSKTLALAEEAGRQGADLTCAYEGFLGIGFCLNYYDRPEFLRGLAEEIPGPVTDKFAEISRRYSMYTSPNFYEICGGKIYNTSALIGRKGEIIGRYRKVHMPATEKWLCTQGSELPVFETDIGNIGFAICYDLCFTEHCRALALKGADIILHQTVGWGVDRWDLGEAHIRVRAAENSVYMAVAKDVRGVSGIRSMIVDNYGAILAEGDTGSPQVVIAGITPDFDKNTNHFDAFFSGVKSTRARKALERMPEVYSVLAEKNPPLTAKRYAGEKLADSPDEITEIFKINEEYAKDEEAGRPGKLDGYTWQR